MPKKIVQRKKPQAIVKIPQAHKKALGGELRASQSSISSRYFNLSSSPKKKCGPAKNKMITSSEKGAHVVRVIHNRNENWSSSEELSGDELPPYDYKVWGDSCM